MNIVANTATAPVVKHLPLNPNGKSLLNFPIDLLDQEGACLHSLEIGLINGSDRNVGLTQNARRIRDDLLSIPGVTELTFYQNWSGSGRDMYIRFSPAFNWEELWVYIEPYFALRLSGCPVEAAIKTLLAVAKESLETPAVVVERYPNNKMFGIHTRKLIYYGNSCHIGRTLLYGESEDKIAPELLSLLAGMRDSSKVEEINVWPYDIGIKVGSGTRDRIIAQVVPQITAVLYPGCVVDVKCIDTPPPPADDKLYGSRDLFFR